MKQAIARGAENYVPAGEHTSHVNGWQEGAVQSAHHAVAQLAAR